MNLPSRLRAAAAAAYIREVHGVPVAEQTLNKLRCIGGGPRFERFGRAVLYRPADLDAWVLARLGSSLRNTAEG
jgi:hypothetical protein